MNSALEQHGEAMRNPRPGFERGMVGLIKSLAELASAHRDRYEVFISEDSYMGEEWAQILSSAHSLLNGETGRLDCGTLSQQIEDLRSSGGSPDAVARVVSATAPKATPKRERTALAPIGTKQLDERQRDLLSLIRVEGNLAVYTGTEQIPDWAALKSVMVALGGKWKSKSGFIFPDDIDAREAVRLAYETGEIIDPKAAEFFETPEHLADQLAAWIRPQPGDVILEPSAGMGALVKAVQRVCPEAKIVACEPLDAHVKALEALGCEVAERDLRKLDRSRQFDAVIMNPPFSKRQDVAHIEAALGLLRVGGRLAAIASAGVMYRDDETGRAFRALIETHGGRIEANPEKSFAAAGTGVSTVSIFLEKRATDMQVGLFDAPRKTGTR